MTPFKNDLQVGQPALVINAEKPENVGKIGMVVTVIELMDLQKSKEYFSVWRDDLIAHPYAVIDDSSILGERGNIAIRQDYLMPLPPLGDVYDDEMFDVMENLKIYS